MEERAQRVELLQQRCYSLLKLVLLIAPNVLEFFHDNVRERVKRLAERLDLRPEEVLLLKALALEVFVVVRLVLQVHLQLLARR